MIKLIYFYIPDGNALQRQNDGDAPKRRAAASKRWRCAEAPRCSVETMTMRRSNAPRLRAEPLREDYVNLRLKRKH